MGFDMLAALLVAFAIAILYAYKLFLESEAREAVDESEGEPDIV